MNIFLLKLYDFGIYQFVNNTSLILYAGLLSLIICIPIVVRIYRNTQKPLPFLWYSLMSMICIYSFSMLLIINANCRIHSKSLSEEKYKVVRVIDANPRVHRSTIRVMDSDLTLKDLYTSNGAFSDFESGDTVRVVHYIGLLGIEYSKLEPNSSE